MRVVNACSWWNFKYTALLSCEHCGHEQMLRDAEATRDYYNNVLPKIKCEQCNQSTIDEKSKETA